MTGTVKKIIGVCLLIVVAALAWANFSYLPKWKKEQEAAFRAAIEKIPAKVRPDTLEFSSFDPSFFDRSVTIENLHFAKTSDEAVNYDIKMKRLQVKGIAIPPKGKGVEDIFDSASVEGMTMVFKAGDGISSEASYDMFSMKGFRADLDLINLAMRSDVTTTQITEALESISVKETRGEGQIGKSDTPFFSQTSSIKKFFGEDISLLGVKRAEYSGLSFKMNDEEFCSIDEMGMEELKMPRILSAIINIETDSMAFQNALSASPIELGKLYVKGLRVKVPGVATTSDITLKDFSFSLRYGASDGELKMMVDSLSVPAEFVAMTPFGMNPFYDKKPLVISKSGDVAWKIDAQGFTSVKMNSLHFSEPSLGAIDAKGDVKFGEEVYTYSAVEAGTLEVKDFSLTVDDKQLVNAFVGFDAIPLLMAADGELEQKAIILSMRASLAAGLSAEAKSEEALKIVQPINMLLTSGGKLTLDFKPEKPIQVSDVKLEAAGMKATYIPPSTPPFPDLVTLEKEIEAKSGDAPSVNEKQDETPLVN